MQKIWLLYDFYFLVWAYIVAKPCLGRYGLATIYARMAPISHYFKRSIICTLFGAIVLIYNNLRSGTGSRKTKHQTKAGRKLRLWGKVVVVGFLHNEHHTKNHEPQNLHNISPVTSFSINYTKTQKKS